MPYMYVYDSKSWTYELELEIFSESVNFISAADMSWVSHEI